MSRALKDNNVHLEITENIFANAPTMLALTLTMMGLVKIYTALQQITTLADNLLVVCLVAFFLATLFSYLALRSKAGHRRSVLARLADGTFLAGLLSAAIVAFMVVFTLAG